MNAPAHNLARAQCYHSLSRLLASPSGEAAEHWQAYEQAIEGLSVASDNLPFDYTKASSLESSFNSDPNALEQLFASYGALFEVGDKGPPLAIREELSPGANPASKEEVARFYEHFGYTLGEAYAWQPDHLSVLMEFMYFLAWHESQATDAKLVGSLRAAQNDFAKRHLADWIPALANNVSVRDDAALLLILALENAAEFTTADIKWLAVTTLSETEA